MRKVLILAAAGITFSCSTQAQALSKCASHEALMAKIGNDPAKLAAMQAAQQERDRRFALLEQDMSRSAQKTTASVTIPVAFHFVLTTQQLSDIGGTNGIITRIANQLEALNTDFNALNTDTSKIPAVFKSLKGSAGFYFALARVNPLGKATTGFDFRTTTKTEFSVGPGSEKHTNQDGLDAWDYNKYLNIWVVNLSTNVLGYAINPTNAAWAGVPEEAGVVIDYAAFGKKTSSDQFFTSGATKGRTAVHEVGHFFDLNHIWGDNDDCQDDDGVSDTPPQDKATTSCPSGAPATVVPNCTNSPGGKMYMNYMDYVDDACMYMFTKGQVQRMQAQVALDSISYKLTQHPNLTNWPTAVADIESINEFSVYPNPANSVFTLNFAQQTKSLRTIDIISVTGQLVKQINITEQSSLYPVDASELNKGIYILQCRFEDGTMTKGKIILQ